MIVVFKLLSVPLVAILLLGCGILNRVPNGVNVTPSGNIITETREVTGFSGVNMSAFGTVKITQGDEESLSITGSDNLVELVTTSVQNGILWIEMEDVNVQPMNKEDILTFEITLKDLDNLTVSGFGTVEMDELETGDLDLVMSGAGVITLDNLTTETVSVNVSGLGGVTLNGTADRIEIQISGAGGVNASDLECNTANAELSGLGTATLWVTDELTGTISGAGGVRYYGTPKTDVTSTGIGSFESLGDK